MNYIKYLNTLRVYNYIYLIYMKNLGQRIKIQVKKEVKITGVCALLERRVTSFGTGAKVDCLKEYIGKKVYLVIVENDSKAGVK